MDVVLKELGPVERLEVRYQCFEASGTARHLDLSIRWLQELFPGDEIAAQRLGIPLDAISFVEDGSTGSPIYRAHAFDANGDEIGSGNAISVLLDAAFTCRTSRAAITWP
ncbi:MAG: hypothetical protein R2849_20035 [Thermomicrobiales bacterium]